MPPIRRSNIVRRTRNAIICENFRCNQTQEERTEANELNICIITSLFYIFNP